MTNDLMTSSAMTNGVRNSHRGFTLIELVVVVAILGILAAFALPRFIDVADQAHDASILGTSGAVSSAVALVRVQWVANGSQGAVTDLVGFGDDTVDTSIDGWPTGVSGNTDPDAMDAAICVDLFKKLLQSNAPTLATVGPGVDYVVTISGGDCRYTYQPNNKGSYIEYDPNEGDVSTVIN